MTGEQTGASSSEWFAAAWAELGHAERLITEQAQTWNAACVGAFDAWTEVGPNGAGRIWVSSHLPAAARAKMNELARSAGHALQRALDLGVFDLSRLVSGALTPPDPDVIRFPVADSLTDFMSAYEGGALDGIRPDQQQFIESMQPFRTTYAPADPRCPHPLRFLLQLGRLHGDADAVTAWAHSARPEVSVSPPCSAAIVAVDPDGPVASPKRLATFMVF